jgi:di/tricarboxylate transporter
MMIMVEGDYKFRDYIKSGVPLVVLMTISLSILLVLNYDL